MPRRSPKKPRVRPEAYALLARIAQYIERFDVRGAALAGAASDELDGLVFRNEVEDLVRRRLLCALRDDASRSWDQHGLCGQSWTVKLTPRALALFWPDRAGDALQR